MENVKGSSSFRNPISSGKHSLLPPKCPFPNISPSFSNYIPGHVLGPKGPPNPRERNFHHIHTSSESFLVQEQPSWFDELLNEPEPPVRKGSHRRASSDSMYLDYIPRNDFRINNMISVPSWGSLDLDGQNYVQCANFYTEPNFFINRNNRAHQSCTSSVMDKVALQNGPMETNGVSCTITETNRVESDFHDPKADFSNANPCSLETDIKRAKQQFAQRSRVRKLQYIAELERTVQVLQAEGCEVTAQLEFVNQQNVILSMENKALKQRLDSLAQEHLIKQLEHEVLEREIARLQVFFQQQQLRTPSSLIRTSSRDLNLQFANLSLRLKGNTSGHNPQIARSFHI